MVEKRDPVPAGWWPELVQPFRSIGERIAGFFAPNADASASGEIYEINLELPGVSESDIEIEVHDGVLTVKGEKRSEREEEGKTYFFTERSYGAFQRAFRLPPDIDADKITADFKNGVLSLSVPKSGPPPEKSKKIEIRTG